MDKTEICQNKNKPLEVQQPSYSSVNTKTRRFKPQSQGNKSFVDSVLELITDPYDKSNADTVDRCLRLNGELMTVPQTEEEMQIIDKIQWDFLMKKPPII